MKESTVRSTVDFAARMADEFPVNTTTFLDQQHSAVAVRGRACNSWSLGAGMESGIARARLLEASTVRSRCFLPWRRWLRRLPRSIKFSLTTMI